MCGVPSASVLLTHFFIKIYLSHFILERVDVRCVWEVSSIRGQTATYWPKVLRTIATLLSHLGWDCSTMGHWRSKALYLPLALNSASCPQLTSTGSNRLGHLVISFSNIHLLLLFFRLFTQGHLLIDGSVEGQYVTQLILWK